MTHQLSLNSQVERANHHLLLVTRLLTSVVQRLIIWSIKESTFNNNKIDSFGMVVIDIDPIESNVWKSSSGRSIYSHLSYSMMRKVAYYLSMVKSRKQLRNYTSHLLPTDIPRYTTSNCGIIQRLQQLDELNKPISRIPARGVKSINANSKLTYVLQVHLMMI